MFDRDGESGDAGAMRNLRSSLLAGYGVMLLVSAAALVALYTRRGGMAGILIAANVVLGGLFLLWVGMEVLGQARSREAAENATLASERERAARAQQTARSIMEALPHAVALVSPEGRVEVANATAGLFGLQAGLPVSDSSHHWLPPLVEKVRATGRSEGRPPAADPPADDA